MKVFVAGATGAIGRPLVYALIAARDEMIGEAPQDIVKGDLSFSEAARRPKSAIAKFFDPAHNAGDR